MTPFDKNFEEVALAMEATRGTEGTVLNWIPSVESGLGDNIEYVKDEPARGSRFVTSSIDKAKQSSEITLSGQMYDGLILFLLKLAFGSVATVVDTPVATVFRHTFTLLEDNFATVPTCSIFLQNPHETRLVTGCVLNTLNFAYDEGGYLTYEAGFLGKFPEDTTTQTVTKIAQNRFLGRKITYKTGVNLASLGSALNITSADFEINNNAELLGVDTDGNPQFITSNNFESSISMERIMENNTQAEKFRNSTDGAHTFEFITENFIVGTTPALFRIEMGKAKIETQEPSGSIGEAMRQSATLVPSKDFTDTHEPLSVILETLKDF